jgi:uncharacterized protein
MPRSRKAETRWRKITVRVLLISATVVTSVLLWDSTRVRADDAFDCNVPEDTMRIDPGRIVAACRRLAEQGDAVAQYILGTMYVMGQGVHKDHLEALVWFLKAAEQGLAEAHYMAGRAYFRGFGVTPDFAVAAKWFHKAAEQGHAMAETELAMMYRTGLGVPEDRAEALKLARQAAEQDDMIGEYLLGTLLEEGSPINPPQLAGAAKWFRKAAEQGHLFAQSQLASMYKLGHGVLKDLVQAYFWYSLVAATLTEAEKRRSWNAADELNELAKSMTAAQIAEAERLVKSWKPRKQYAFRPL